MSTPITRINSGSALTRTTASAIANNAYATTADDLTIDNTAGALLADFELQVTFAVAPVAGAVMLVASDYSLDGATAGPAPSATLLGRVVGSFSPQFAASNTTTAMRLRINNVALAPKTDYYLYNAGTGQPIPAGSVLRAQLWSPGT